MHRRLAADLSTIIDQDLDRASRFSLPSPPLSPITRLHAIRTRPVHLLRPKTSQHATVHTRVDTLSCNSAFISNSVHVQVHAHATKSRFTSHDAAC